MSEIPFHTTRMGHTFYDGTMPSLVREIARLNDNIERLLAIAESGSKIAAAAPKPEGETEDRT
jgi:hypothetical protein